MNYHNPIMCTIIKPSINIINHSFKYVFMKYKHYNIPDEAIGLKPVMDIFTFSKQIYNNEVDKKTNIKKYANVIYASAIGHNICMNETDGIIQYQHYLTPIMNYDEVLNIGKIIQNTSYSNVKLNGYPILHDYQLAYHIVREADLLASYDFNRCVIYNMFHNNPTHDYNKAVTFAIKVFENRVLTMIDDDLFVTEYSKMKSIQLHNDALQSIINITCSIGKH